MLRSCEHCGERHHKLYGNELMLCHDCFVRVNVAELNRVKELKEERRKRQKIRTKLRQKRKIEEAGMAICDNCKEKFPLSRCVEDPDEQEKIGDQYFPIYLCKDCWTAFEEAAEENRQYDLRRKEWLKARQVLKREGIPKVYSEQYPILIKLKIEEIKFKNHLKNQQNDNSNKQRPTSFTSVTRKLHLTCNQRKAGSNGQRG